MQAEGWRQERTEKIHISLENKNLDWKHSEVQEFIRLAEEAYHLDQIAAFFKRDMLEVFILYLDLVDRRKIETKLKVVYTE